MHCLSFGRGVSRFEVKCDHHLQGYTVQYFEDQEGIWLVADPYVPNLYQVIHDLTPGSVYR